MKREDVHVEDGLALSPTVEHQINEAFAIALRGKVGDTILNYLRSISSDRVFAAGVDPNTVLHAEGSRWIAGVIQERLRRGRTQPKRTD